MPFRRLLAALAVAFVAVPAPVGADDAERQKLVIEMFRVLQYDAMIDQMAGGLAGQITGQVKAKHPNLDPAAEADILAITQESFAGLKPELMLFAGQSLVKHFTEDELRQLLAFYNTDVGRKSIAVMPQMMQETMVWSQGAVQRMVPGLVERIRTRLREKGYEL